MGLYIFFPSIYWPDEIFQTQEAGHRLAYGYGVIPWEFRLGIRSWVLPACIAVIMKCTAWMGSGSSGYLLGIALCFSLVSLAVVWFAFVWCRDYLGMEYAFLAAFVTATWFELVHFGPRVLNEFVAGNLLLPAIYLGSLKSGQQAENRWRLFAVGLLLGLVVCLRMQFGPAVLLAGLWIMSGDWRVRFAPISLGIFLIVLAFGAVDAFTWSWPFYSYYAFFTENIVHHRAAEFGVLPWYYFISALFFHTGPLLIFAVLAVRRVPILGWIALAVLFPHLLIGHKEFRFIYPVLPIVLMLAAIGIIDCLRFLDQKMAWRMAPEMRILIAAGIATACSLTLASQFPRWDKARGALQAFSRLSKDQLACGVALVKVPWANAGGYTYLHRQIPIFFFGNFTDAHPVSPSFDRIVTPEESVMPLEGFSLSRCQNGECVYQREGDCKAGGTDFELNEYLKSRGE
ncbi:MAG TPA: hypothetical protein VFI38_05235 [Candidatus Acidoferrum sp.]|nr:hypothetical protein [Candidatus Acidoferrum sp.]